LQVADETLQLAERGGVGRGRDPLAMLLHRELTLGQRAVQQLARLGAIGVPRPHLRGAPRRHADDRRADQIVKTGA
jgi:hypothetical protein